MKELLNGILCIVGSVLVTVLIMPICFIYSFLYSIWCSVYRRDYFAFLRFWWRLLDGFAASIGHMLYHISVALDMSWNVNGELIEDLITDEDDTEFTKRNTTVSASVGKLQIENKLNNRGKILSNTLSVAFSQRQHAIDAWLYKQAKSYLDSQYFHKK